MRRHIESALSVVITLIFVIAGVVGVMAGAGTITVLDGSGNPQIYTIVTDGSGHYLANNVICDYSAGANCATVNSSHQIGVIDANSAALLAAATSAIVSGTNVIGQVSIDQTTPGTTNKVAVTNSDPCTYAAKTNFAFATSAANVQIVTGSTSKKVYICSMSLISATAGIVNVIEGTGSACTTANEAAVIGSTTAANGLSLAANGGLTYGSGAATVAAGSTATNGLCILQSGTAVLSGNVTYIQQ